MKCTPHCGEILSGEEVKNYMTFKKRFITAIATGAVLVNALAPVALANSLNVTGNGAFSNSAINVSSNSTTSVNQTNNANITNNVSSNANTGDNSANFNTGGDSKIVTGDATTNTSISNAANLNKASLSNCGGCEGGATNVTITGNGAYSENEVEVSKDKSVFLNQDNNANISNDVEAKANTGKNDNSFNTGGDSVTVTGDAKTSVSIDTKANANIAKLGGNGSAGGSSVLISGNGAFSDNDAALNGSSAVVLDQFNDANVDNDVEAKANTGKNDSTFNTGGFVGISTGNASTHVDVDNAVNFNLAKIDCDCVFDGVEVKVAGNGAYSENEVDASADNVLFHSQDNYADLYNDVDDSAKTGKNDVSFSTSDVDGDPLVVTGNAKSWTDVNNHGNVNILNEGSSLHLPGNLELGLNWDLNDLWDSLNWLV